MGWWIWGEDITLHDLQWGWGKVPSLVPPSKFKTTLQKGRWKITKVLRSRLKTRWAGWLLGHPSLVPKGRCLAG